MAFLRTHTLSHRHPVWFDLDSSQNVYLLWRVDKTIIFLSQLISDQPPLGPKLQEYMDSLKYPFCVSLHSYPFLPACSWAEILKCVNIDSVVTSHLFC